MEAETLREQLLAAARRDFAAFYLSATPADAVLMGALVFARAHLVMLMNAPRANLAPHLRIELERAADIAEHYFIDVREEMRACATFTALPDAEQIRIERTLFDIKPPITWS